MIFSRGTGVISHIKLIIGMMICLLTVITGTANKIEPNVTLDVASEVTTLSTEINFVLENKGSATISKNTYLKSFEKKVDGQWQEIPFDIHLNDVDANYITNPTMIYFFPNETAECKFKINWLFDDEQATLDAGEYKVTFGFISGVRNFKGEEFKDGYASCEIEVKAA